MPEQRAVMVKSVSHQWTKGVNYLDGTDNILYWIIDKYGLNPPARNELIVIEKHPTVPYGWVITNNEEKNNADSEDAGNV